MGSSKGRRGSGASLANSPQRLEQHEAEGGWRGRVKILASSTFGAAATKEQGVHLCVCHFVRCDHYICSYIYGCGLWSKLTAAGLEFDIWLREIV